MKSRLKMEQLNNYALYYGTGKETELANFDLAIVEPLGQTRSSIQFMHEKETLVIAYISVIEIHPTNLLFGLLKDEDIENVKLFDEVISKRASFSREVENI